MSLLGACDNNDHTISAPNSHCSGKAQVGPTLSIQSSSMQTAANGTKTIKGLKLMVNGVEIRADEATVAATDAVLELRGNVTVTIPQGWVAVPTR